MGRWHGREQKRWFWAELRVRGSTKAAAEAIGVTRSTAANWVSEAGGMPPSMQAPSGLRLTFLEREEIWFGRSQGESMRSIAARLGRAPSTISRELRILTSRRGYRPSVAHREAQRRLSRPKPRKLQVNDRLRDYVQTELEADHSPEQIMLRLRREFPDDQEMRVSHETIYQALYVQGRGGLRRELAAALRTGRTLRRPRAATGARSRAKVLDMVLIAERPDEVEGRKVPGHWEGDLIIGKDSGSAIGTLVERTTGFVMLLHLPGQHGALEVRDQMITAIGKMPEMLRRSITWDQGIEMAAHKQISIATGIDIYFCDPHSPWQRGTNENTNGLLEWSPKVGHLIQGPLSRRNQMYSESTLSHPDAVSAIEMFEQGFAAKSVALALDLARAPVQMLFQRWQLRGSGALVTRDRKLYDFDTKLEIVRRHVGGESGRALAQEFDLPSPSTVANWTSKYRRDGPDGLRPKRRGRPPTTREDAPPETETEALRRENERLRAEVAYLGKLRALRFPERR